MEFLLTDSTPYFECYTNIKPIPELEYNQRLYTKIRFCINKSYDGLEYIYLPLSTAELLNEINSNTFDMKLLQMICDLTSCLYEGQDIKIKFAESFKHEMIMYKYLIENNKAAVLEHYAGSSYIVKIIN